MNITCCDREKDLYTNKEDSIIGIDIIEDVN